MALSSAGCMIPALLNRMLILPTSVSESKTKMVSMWLKAHVCTAFCLHQQSRTENNARVRHMFSSHLSMILANAPTLLNLRIFCALMCAMHAPFTAQREKKERTLSCPGCPFALHTTTATKKRHMHVPHLTKLRDSQVDHLLDILLLADIGLDGDCTASTKHRGDLLHRRSRALLVDVRAHNLGAL